MIRSKVLYTDEIDDMELATQELFDQVGDFTLSKNSVGLLFFDSDTEYDELYPILKEKWDIPFIGATALAILTGKQGYCKSGISLMLLTSDDCKFAVGMVEDMNGGNYREKITATYQEIERELGEEPKLILTYGGKGPGMVPDDVIDVIDGFGKNIPIYGALASDVFTFQSYRVFCNEKGGMTNQAFLLISGNLNPHFLHVSSVSGRANFSYEVTKSEENRVDRLGNGTFLEALKKADMMAEKTYVVADYIMTPFVTTLKRPNGKQVEAMRNLTTLNLETGSGSFLGGIPEGSSLEVGFLNSMEAQRTVKEAFDHIWDWMKENGEELNTILCSSCAARYMSLGQSVGVEAASYQNRLPENVSLMGLYSYGEFCPVGDTELDNIFHNSTFTVLCM